MSIDVVVNVTSISTFYFIFCYLICPMRTTRRLITDVGMKWFLLLTLRTCFVI